MRFIVHRSSFIVCAALIAASCRTVGVSTTEGGFAEISPSVAAEMIFDSSQVVAIPTDLPLDCAAITEGKYRNFRSGSNDDIAATLRSSVRHVYYPEYHGVVGSRCVRDAGS